MPYVDVLLREARRSFDRLYRYRWPAELNLPAEACGLLVQVPFGRGNSLREAIVLRSLSDAEAAAERTAARGKTESTSASAPEEPALKTVAAVLSEPMLGPDHPALIEEMRRRYFCSRADALAALLPTPILKVPPKTETWYSLSDPEEALCLLEEGSLRSLKHQRVLELLLDSEALSVSELMAAAAVSRAVLKTLEKKGLISPERRQVKRQLSAARQFPEKAVERLNPEQMAVLERLEAAFQAGRQQEFLLHGITGSGKTEVYLSLAEKVLAAGQDVLILVPEIALTPLMLSRLQARFGPAAAVLHSRLTLTERYEEWMAVKRGEKHLVIGARSAVFAPLAKIGLIVLDEEHENSYKAERKPRYDARDIARLRSLAHQSVLVLGSATPSLESYVRTERGKAELLTLQHRAVAGALPEARMVDLRSDYGVKGYNFISQALYEAMQATFARGEQVLLFLNRRGKARYVQCTACGETLSCPNCDLSLTEHLQKYGHGHQLICHYCGQLAPLPSACPACGAHSLQSFGIGTQEVESAVQALFPNCRVLRMDQDTTSSRGGHAELLHRFAEGQADCLIGTQMVAKGHDFPKLTLVGILAADQLLALSDYRSEERAFQLITQCAGRAGRHDSPGLVLIQTYQPLQPCLQAALRQDYAAFYRAESAFRERQAYPPYVLQGYILVQGFAEAAVAQAAQELSAQIQQALNRYPEWGRQLKLFAAEAAPIPRLNRRYRYRILLKATAAGPLYELFNQIADRDFGDLQVLLDVNPQNLQ